MRSPLENSVRAAFGPGNHAFHGRAGADEALRHIQIVHVHVEVVIRIGDGRFQKLQKILAGRLGGLLQDRLSDFYVFAADEVQNDLNFAGSDPDMSTVSLSIK